MGALTGICELWRPCSSCTRSCVAPEWNEKRKRVEIGARETVEKKRLTEESSELGRFSCVHILDPVEYFVVNLHCWNKNVKALGMYALASHLSDGEKTIAHGGFRGPVSSLLCPEIRWCPMPGTMLDNWTPSAALVWLMWPVRCRRLPVRTQTYTWMHWQAESCSRQAFKQAKNAKTKLLALLHANLASIEPKQRLSVDCVVAYTARRVCSSAAHLARVYTFNGFCFVETPRFKLTAMMDNVTIGVIISFPLCEYNIPGA